MVVSVGDNVWVKCGVNGDYEELAAIQKATEQKITVKYIVSGIQDVVDRERVRPMEDSVGENDASVDGKPGRRVRRSTRPVVSSSKREGSEKGKGVTAPNKFTNNGKKVKSVKKRKVITSKTAAKTTNNKKAKGRVESPYFSKSAGKETAKKSPYCLIVSIEEAHEHPIFCAAFSPAKYEDSDGSESKYFATCAGQYVHIYEIDTTVCSRAKKLQNSVGVRQAYCDADEEEEFYTCVFGGRGLAQCKFNLGGDKKYEGKGKKQLRIDTKKDTPAYYDLSLRQGPPLLCVAGKRGIIKVIDTVLQSLVMTLLGHGDIVNDLKCSPTNDWLLLSASKDHSIRLWNLQFGQMIAIYAGHDGHRGQVLSLSWHHSGTKFASSAFDNTIKLWNVCDDATAGESEKEGPIQAAIRRSFEMKPGDKFTTAIEQTPYFSNDEIHDFPGCVDCVQFVGDLILSKSVQNVLVLWKPVVTSEDVETFNTIYPNNFINKHKKNNDRIKSKVIFLRQFTTDNCDSWFIRFGSPPPYNEILALGNCEGEVKVWKLMGSEDDDEEEHLDDDSEGLICKLNTGESTVRMVAVAGKDYIVAVCDDSSVWVFKALE